MRRAALATVMIAVLASVLAVACGDDGDGGAEATVLAVQGHDYRFAGLPESVEPGTYTFTFENAGSEFHEMTLVRLPEGMTIGEALQLPEEETFEVLGLVGIVFATPGELGAQLTVDLEPGTYAFVCFIENEQGPHAFQGMVAQLTVAA